MGRTASVSPGMHAQVSRFIKFTDRVNEKMLLAIRYLNHGEVARILKHYETYTGMDYWYKEDLDEIAEDV